MSFENAPAGQRPAYKHKYDVIGYLCRNRVHIILITLCALLLFGDFLTTSIALSLSGSGDSSRAAFASEGNPLMSEVANAPVLFLFVKGLILQVVIVSAYLLRKEGALAYLPCVLVCGFYVWVNLNNINVLAMGWSPA